MSAIGTRRTTLQAGASFLVAGVVTSPAPLAAQHPDATLLALCDRYHAIDRQAHELDHREDKAAEAEREAFWDRQQPLVEKMCELQATTLAGLRALARAYAAWEGPEIEHLLQSALVGDKLLGTLLRDLGAVQA